MLFVIFFFYRDGEVLSQKSLALLTRMSGSISAEVRDIIVNTTRSVVFGIVGSAAGQGVVALIGFWIAGVPGAITLGVPPGVRLICRSYRASLSLGSCCFLALLQRRSRHGDLPRALGFACAVSSVDNFLKPILISKGASLPLSLIYLGVFGGVLAFGFMGIILGPVVIAVGIAMSETWLSVSATVNDRPADRQNRDPFLRSCLKIRSNPTSFRTSPENREALTTIITANPKNDGQK